MTVKLSVPLRSILEAPAGELVLDFPKTCSRCGASSADKFETHRLKLRAGYNPTHLYGKKYRLNKNYQLKIRVCDNCYLADYLTAPETLDRDPTPIGKIARFQSSAWMAGGLTAALGLLLLTSFNPFPALRTWWPAVLGAGVLILFSVWLSRRRQQKNVLAALAARGINPAEHPRNEARTPILETEQDQDTIALEIGMDNEQWARACAEHRGWTCEKLESFN